jgi:hypothetical protein
MSCSGGELNPDRIFNAVISNPSLSVIPSIARNLFISLRTGSVRNPCLSRSLAILGMTQKSRFLVALNQ